MKKNYKNYETIQLGDSDKAFLKLVGFRNNIEVEENLNFGEDNYYKAYLVDENAEIGSHYELRHTYNNKVEIYDDMGHTQTIKGNTINIYRAAMMGCIIQVI